MAILIIILILVALAILIIALVVLLKKQREYVSKNSPYLNAIRDVNHRIPFDRGGLISQPRIRLESKRAFDRFDVDRYLKSYFLNNKESIEKNIKKVHANIELYNNYCKAINNVKKSFYEYARQPKYLLSKNRYFKLENEIASTLINKSYPEIKIIVIWSYTSPAGRNHYELSRTLLTKDIERLYNSIFISTIKTKDEQVPKNSNEFIKQPQKNTFVDVESTPVNKPVSQEVSIYTRIKGDFVNPAYSLDQAKEILRKNHILPSEQILEEVMRHCGYIKKKGSVYVRKDVLSMQQIILNTADDKNYIKYSNAVKDEAYDKTITDLESQRKIVPINSMMFLKIDEVKPFGDFNYSDLIDFDRQLKMFANNQTFVTVKTVKETLKCKFVETDFDDCFIDTLIKYSQIVYPVQNIKGLYSINYDAERYDFLLFVVGNNESLNAFDLISAIKEYYGIEYNIYSIQYDINKQKNGLYYNEETEKIYKNKETFFKEVV